MKRCKVFHFAIITITLIVLMFSGNAMAAYLLQDNFDSENGGVGALNYIDFANWTVTSGAVDLIPLQGGQFDFLPGNGLYVDLDGSTGVAGTIESAVFNLTPGNYTLEFYLAGNRRGGNDTVIVTVALGTLVNETITLASGVPFTDYEFDFNVSSPTSATIVFKNLGGDNVGLLLDEVELEQVPEPTTMLLLGFGIIGLAGVRRLRK